MKSTKATKIYRDERTFTLTSVKLEISVLEEKQNVVSDSIKGWEKEEK